MQYNTMQYNTMQYDTMQYNTIQCKDTNTIQYIDTRIQSTAKWIVTTRYKHNTIQRCKKQVKYKTEIQTVTNTIQ